ncbi:hypothetical protein C5Y96_06600 [Blastopirellula marina]|uniref:Uncharacterized protein n=1 Tax=Blastopirellula marina TaxID=124 RepID=A0A2S8FXC7_9BACT|nr:MULTISPECIES: hypothetical protein [Pirellulaceae]PQO36831.1 hypothetical protein C5Y96_06600 [Blastopirellula marina]RCS53546.1 hypothetical protein DTL36_06610 [Bremerella cremea]
MPISFHCETCRRSICVPDGSEGKKTRCPNCYSIVQIPFSGSPKLSTMTEVPKESEFAPLVDDDPLGIVGKTESRWDQPTQQPSINPFADQPDLPASAPATAVLPKQPAPNKHKSIPSQASTVSLLATILMLLSLIMLIPSLLSIGANVIALDDIGMGNPEQVGSLAGMITVFVLQILTIIALNEARTLRNYSTARTGMVLALIPCSNPATLLIIPLGLAIWGVLLIHAPQVRDAFESERGYTPD